jgi:TonB family protein
MKTMLLVTLTVASAAARAQNTEGLHVAPGMMVHPPTKGRAKDVKPVVLAPPEPLLPRFWHGPGTEAQAAGLAQVYYFVRYNTRYPGPALAIRFEGKVTVRAVINAAGELVSTEIIDRHEPVIAQQEAANSLEAEALRVVRLMKFQPGTEAREALTIPLIYSLP